jgi:hypothetical protein
MDNFLGLNNREQPKRMPEGSLVIADNIDIDDAGGITLRNGSSLIRSGTYTSVFTTQDQRRIFVVDNGDLKLIEARNTPIIINTGLPSEYIYWMEVADYILMSTGQLIDKNNNVTTWRIPRPLQPRVSIASGLLKAGQYKVCSCFVDNQGRQGGASDIVDINIPSDDSCIIISADFISGYSVNVYVSEKDSSTLYLHQNISTASTTIFSTAQLNHKISEEQLDSYPAPDNAKILAYYQSQVYASEYYNGTSTVWFSKPFWWNLFGLQSDYFQVPGRITGMMGSRQGIVICTEDEIYIYTEDSLVRVAEYGTPDGCPLAMDDNGSIYIYSKQGFCLGVPFKNLTEQTFSMKTGSSCFLQFVEQDGIKKLVALNDGLGNSDNEYKI